MKRFPHLTAYGTVTQVCMDLGLGARPVPEVSEEDWKVWLSGFDIPYIFDCPVCDGRLIEKTGKHGKFLGCSRFPACKHTQELEDF